MTRQKLFRVKKENTTSLHTMVKFQQACINILKGDALLYQKKTGITKFQKFDNDHRQKSYCRKKDKKNGQNICTKKTRTYIGEKKGGLSNKKVPEGLTLKHANKKLNGEKTLLLSEKKKT